MMGSKPAVLLLCSVFGRAGAGYYGIADLALMHGDFCLYCVASSEWDKLAPHVSSGPQPKKN